MCLLLALAACAKPIHMPSYDDFVSVRKEVVPATVLEIYGRMTATASGKSAKASFNLLLEPGKNAYLEILGPGQQMTYAFGLNVNQLTLLWAKDKQYITEEATPQNVQKIAGFPVQPDDLLLLIAGYGLNFPEWKAGEPQKDGWILQRAPFSARLAMKDQISRIVISSSTSPEVRVEYSDYARMNDRLVPRTIRMEVPARHTALKLQIDKFLPRDEPASADLFKVPLPPDAKKLSLREIFTGKPLIY